MNQEDTNLEKRKLVEELGVYFEKERLIAPVAARILSLLVINGYDGTTFEQLVENLEASKSTISTHLTTLEGLQWITYFTRCGDRKRYYRMNPGYLNRRIESLTGTWENEISLHERVIHFKRGLYVNHSKFNENELSGHEEVIRFLKTAVSLLRELINTYNQTNKQNNLEEL